MTGNVIVVGAGIIGSTTALRLAEAGLKVTLCDGSEPGGEQSASYGNGGWISPASIIPMSMPGLWRQVPGFLLDRNGPLTLDWKSVPRLTPWLLRFLLAGATNSRVTKTAAKLNWLLHDGPKRHLELASKTGQEHLIVQKGLLYAYPDRAAFEAEALSWQLRRDNGILFDEWQEAELRERIPALGSNYRFAIHVTEGAHCLDTGGYVAGIAAQAEKAGVRFIRRNVVRVLTGVSPRVVLDNDESIAADHIVLAAGIHSGRIMHDLGMHVPMQSERGYHVTLPMAELPFDIPIMPSTGRMGNTPTNMGLRLSGQVELATVEKAPDWRRSEVLLKHALASYPDLAKQDLQNLKLWMGHRPSPADGVPVIGKLTHHQGIVAAFGHGHIGIAAAPKTAEIVLDAINNVPPSDSVRAFSPARFGC
ncbi:NAD(P)/FAD-dependent oxidoreductase [Brucella anthropi]|uniref:FAD dependent oxidoreductase n=1 Tax=Brucella anthropi (strain ATCC 49188 / DSM 6882 / CCUG 24695 / JCM 21032 / LMG 3331 / NBRC 15819 / NCTC 12168 / Alc 37) TaxID=439375 RepID=A6X6C3_BRUA4|nr:FAD-binding oxidoreductase [Brucella anthropi]ABS16777.1 FAD dependent oxidoreductase [Brucella anthropi ATCC 49188]AIK41481.1 3-hydroxyacyl-CoA dehydrogenase, NAD binding domain protein [Brucella anthropi]KAB2732633.1 FAD-binding oxidoreductase [Brucella anthropi]KAB2754004.1 FAD-binding oxidoreductase [Brucella anthropi]KAB2780820.1 FAD-binding oxidoreductase [Brucella anthropi]